MRKTPREEEKGLSVVTNFSSSNSKQMTNKVRLAVRHQLVLVDEEDVGGDVVGSLDLECVSKARYAR